MNFSLGTVFKYSKFFTLYVLPLDVSYLVFFYLVPPTQIQMMNHMSGSRIDIKENTEVEISCKVSNAKPRAGIIWYRNNLAFNPGIGQFFSFNAKCAGIANRGGQ